MTKKHIAQVVGITALVAVVHSLIPEKYFTLHILFRLFYFVPIVIAALAGGRKVGLLASLAVSLVFLPHFFFPGASSEFIAGNVLGIILFILCGIFVGSFRDSSEKNLVKRLHEAEVTVPSRTDEKRRVLFYTDGSPLSLSSAHWLRNRYDLSKMSVVLLNVLSHDREEILADKFAGRQQQEKALTLAKSLEEIHSVLLNGGMEEKDIETVTESITQRMPISDKIVEYANEHDFDWIFICKHNKNKSEEFLFGDTAIQVLRKTSTPMLIVKGTEEQAAQSP